MSIATTLTLEQRVIRAIATALTVPPEMVKPTTVLDAELSVDALDLVEIEMNLEDELDIQFQAGQTLEDVRTVADVVNVVGQLLQAKEGAQQ